jgi:hypothetical protein
MRKRIGVVFAAVFLVAYSSVVAVAAPLPEWGTARASGLPFARFEGGWIDLSKGWSPASACIVLPGRAAECFRTSAAMERREASFVGLIAPNLNCSTPLRLHDGTYQAGTTVSVYVRGLWVDLSTFGFDNSTSSYTVGACAIELALGSGGSGLHYPRCLYAGCVENVMATGWNNAVSSVYLH